MTVLGVVAVATDGAIGRDGDLPWHYPADLRHFKDLTTGHVLLMGRATYESLPGPLPERTHVVLSRTQTPGTDDDGVLWTPDPEDALTLARTLECDLFVIGGAEIYALLADRIDEWWVTRVPETVPDADTHFDPAWLDGHAPVERDPAVLGRDLLVEHYTRVES